MCTHVMNGPSKLFKFPEIVKPLPSLGGYVYTSLFTLSLTLTGTFPGHIPAGVVACSKTHPRMSGDRVKQPRDTTEDALLQLLRFTTHTGR
jgi:hypothetical protein